MTETATRMCRICLTSNEDNIISDSTCYAKFFMHFMSLENFNEILWLCLRCKSSLKRAIALFTLAMDSEKVHQDKFTTDIPNNSKKIYSLNYYHNPHIDIPPVILEYEDNNSENKTETFEELNDPIKEIQIDVETPINISKKDMKSRNQEPTDSNIKKEKEISNLEQDIFENGIAKRKRKEYNFKELQFEVEYLSLEEQLKEFEMRKVKFKGFTFQCDECGMGFLTNNLFDEHKIRHTELTGPHKCKICHLHYKSADLLSQHMLIHNRRFRCLVCNTVLLKRWSLCVVHRYTCGGGHQPTACGECSKIFSNEHSLKIHMKVHNKEKKYCCDQCDKKYFSKQHLTVHMRTHSGQKPFSCSHCDRSFSTNSNLRAHTAVHDDASRFYCVECNTYYKTEKSLKRHFNASARHMNFQSDWLSCTECSKQFPTEQSLNYHMTTRHKTVTEHRCAHCNKTFASNSNLKKHIKCIHTTK